MAPWSRGSSGYGRDFCFALYQGWGEKDWNVPVQNSEQLYQALRRRGIITQLVVYPGEHHGRWTTAHEKDFLERRLAWYDQYVKGEASWKK